jgi:hypothetical protein
MKPSHNRAHVILTVNGVQGACAAALVLQKYREARIRLTSPRHLPAALNELADARFRGTVHLCGIDAAEPVEDLLPSLDGLAASAQIIWYGGKNHAGLARRAPALAKHCELVLTKHDTDVECIAEHLGLLKSARTLSSWPKKSDDRAGPSRSCTVIAMTWSAPPIAGFTFSATIP